MYTFHRHCWDPNSTAHIWLGTAFVSTQLTSGIYWHLDNNPTGELRAISLLDRLVEVKQLNIDAAVRFVGCQMDTVDCLQAEKTTTCSC